MPASEYRRQGLAGSLVSFLASRRFFILLLIFFAVEALWIALSGRYPMAFDESYHLGVIQLYAHHLSPFWNGQPPGADVFGAITRDPSYLYHWLMSFPYRLIELLTHSQTAQVLVLRFMNIGLFAAGLVLYRRLLLKTGASRAIVHFCLALFVLIPIVPLLAAQINYDNMYLPLVALSLILTLDFGRGLSRQRPDLKALLRLAIVLILASLVKYAFLPVASAIAVYLSILAWRAYPSFRQLGTALTTGFKNLPRRTLWSLVIFLLISLGLFAERYAVNLARYHGPAPVCDKVLTIDQCRANGPWNRDYEYAQTKPADVTRSPLAFGADWFYGMWFRTFFAVDGSGTGYQSRGPLPLPALGAVVFSVAALAATIAAWRRVWRRSDQYVLWLLILVTAIYTAILWLNGYHSFLETGRPAGLNGRYLLSIFPLLMIILALGVSAYLRNRERFKLALAGLALLCLLWGGGALTYILRSNDAWYWPDRTVKDANHAVQKTIGPLVPGYNNPRAFMGPHGT